MRAIIWLHEVAQSLPLSRPAFPIQIVPLYKLIHVCRIWRNTSWYLNIQLTRIISLVIFLSKFAITEELSCEFYTVCDCIELPWLVLDKWYKVKTCSWANLKSAMERERTSQLPCNGGSGLFSASALIRSWHQKYIWA